MNSTRQTRSQTRALALVQSRPTTPLIKSAVLNQNPKPKANQPPKRNSVPISLAFDVILPTALPKTRKSSRHIKQPVRYEDEFRLHDRSFNGRHDQWDRDFNGRVFDQNAVNEIDEETNLVLPTKNYSHGYECDDFVEDPMVSESVNELDAQSETESEDDEFYLSSEDEFYLSSDSDTELDLDSDFEQEFDVDSDSDSDSTDNVCARGFVRNNVIHTTRGANASSTGLRVHSPYAINYTTCLDFNRQSTPKSRTSVPIPTQQTHYKLDTESDATEPNYEFV
jgi:hypothetical protein